MKIYKREIIPYIFVLLCVVGNYSLFNILNFIPNVVLFMFFGGLMLIQYKVYITVKDVYKLIYFMITFLILLIWGNKFTDLSFIAIVACFFVSYLAIKSYIAKRGIKSFLLTLENIIYYITVISLVFFIFGTCLHIIPNSGVIPSETVGWSKYITYTNYFNLYYDGHYTDFFGMKILRNSSIFAEAPLYATILIFAVYINLFLKEANDKRVFIYIVAAITTFSTTAISICTLIVAYKFYENYLKGKKLIVILPFIILVTVYAIAMVLIDKIGSNNISGIIRIDDLRVSILAWMDSPIIGNGFKNMDVFTPYRGILRGVDAGMSTGIGNILSDGGLVLGLLYIVPFFYSIMQIFKRQNIRINIIVALIFLVFLIMISQYTIWGSFLLAISWILTDKKIQEDENGREWIL